jgi:MoaA/NifB/PqqE/SkfB family radical SAM enzyme
MLRAWLQLASGTLTFEEFYEFTCTQRELTFLAIDATGACDLTCESMCYYHPGIDIRARPSSIEALNKAVSEADSKLNLKALVVAGKEPLLNARRVFELTESAAGIEGRGFIVGIVTNGRHIHRHWPALVRAAGNRSLNFIDVSIDSGIPEQHDAIRGLPGTFDLSFAAVQEAVQRLQGVRVGVTSVLRKDNADGIIQLLRKASPAVSNFCVHPIQPPPFVASPPLDVSDLSSFLGKLIKLLDTELAGANIEVLVLIHGIYAQEAESCGFFSWSELREDQHGQIFASKALGGNKVVYTLSILPECGWRQARITYTGDYLATAHFLQTPSPADYSVGNIESDSIVSLYEKSKEPRSHFYQLLQARKAHACRRRPCWYTCFGGWTVSENGFISGHPLTDQPRLCLKTESDFSR